MVPKKPTSRQDKGSACPVEIFLFVPNLIGYLRIVLALTAYFIAAERPALFLTLYSVSFVLDALDGMAARALNQCSHFGAVLDMLTDRAATAGLLVVLDKVVQPKPYNYTFAFALLVFLDVASHFCRMYVSVFANKVSHKDVSESLFVLLKHYYSNRKLMACLCIGQELAYLFLYAYSFYGTMETVGTIIWWGGAACALPCILKQVVNVQQLVDGLYHIGCIDAAERAAKGS